MPIFDHILPKNSSSLSKGITSVLSYRSVCTAPGELFAGAEEGDTVEINVLGKVKSGEDSARGITERLRKKSKDA